MEAVAEHINEMQKIYEEYGSILDEMMKDYRETHPQARASKSHLNITLFEIDKGVSKVVCNERIEENLSTLKAH